MSLCKLQIIDKEAVEEVKASREMPEIRPGYIIQMKVVAFFLFLEKVEFSGLFIFGFCIIANPIILKCVTYLKCHDVVMTGSTR